MTVHTQIRAASVVAVLNFLKPMAERPRTLQYEPEPGIPQRNAEDEAHLVSIHDARPLAPTLSLDVQGFEYLHAPTSFAAYNDDAAIRSFYYPKVQRHLAAATGARQVIAFDHNVRNAARAASGEAGIRGPVPRTHNDFTAKSGRERVLAELRARGLDPSLLDGRFAIVNLWRPIGRNVEKWPLALVDARTLAADDLVATDLVYRDRVGETYSLGFSPGQRWYYFPQLAPDEAILIKGYDSQEEGVARFAAHSAFEDPQSPANARERESIEVRALVIY
ncbi:CmcJ/NvfI family oxidoreductase [Allosphingosinicella sp.]|uniref:CmcJ/NvfI family oxidoreductase n=1 Tax=Allosphingosinicella sp. TaxID=2823234 RepID=UPI0037837911